VFALYASYLFVFFVLITYAQVVFTAKKVYEQGTMYYMHGSRSPCKDAILMGKGAVHCNVLRLPVMSCAKVAETYRDVVWDVESGGSREACIRWGAH